MKAPSSFLKKYFWDMDPETLDLQAHSKDIIERILEYGDTEGVHWMKEHYTKEEIADVLCRYRFVSPQSANFWALILNLPKEKILCLQKPYLETQRRNWHY